ncbi:MAG: conjugative transposon protein TraK, partial [Bacteroidota bacterium]
MFSRMKNIDTSFRHIRIFTLAVVIAFTSISCFALYKSFRLVYEMQNKVYILANGKALEVYASDRKDNIQVEARDHVKNFHQYFFTLDPDDKVIQANITRA